MAQSPHRTLMPEGDPPYVSSPSKQSQPHQQQHQHFHASGAPTPPEVNGLGTNGNGNGNVLSMQQQQQQKQMHSQQLAQQLQQQQHIHQQQQMFAFQQQMHHQQLRQQQQQQQHAGSDQVLQPSSPGNKSSTDRGGDDSPTNNDSRSTGNDQGAGEIFNGTNAGAGAGQGQGPGIMPGIILPPLAKDATPEQVQQYQRLAQQHQHQQHQIQVQNFQREQHFLYMQQMQFLQMQHQHQHLLQQHTQQQQLQHPSSASASVAVSDQTFGMDQLRLDDRSPASLQQQQQKQRLQNRFSPAHSPLGGSSPLLMVAQPQLWPPHHPQHSHPFQHEQSQHPHLYSKGSSLSGSTERLDIFGPGTGAAPTVAMGGSAGGPYVSSPGMGGASGNRMMTPPPGFSHHVPLHPLQQQQQQPSPQGQQDRSGQPPQQQQLQPSTLPQSTSQSQLHQLQYNQPFSNWQQQQHQQVQMHLFQQQQILQEQDYMFQLHHQQRLQHQLQQQSRDQRPEGSTTANQGFAQGVDQNQVKNIESHIHQHLSRPASDLFSPLSAVPRPNMSGLGPLDSAPTLEEIEREQEQLKKELEQTTEPTVPVQPPRRPSLVTNASLAAWKASHAVSDEFWGPKPGQPGLTAAEATAMLNGSDSSLNGKGSASQQSTGSSTMTTTLSVNASARNTTGSRAEGNEKVLLSLTGIDFYPDTKYDPYRPSQQVFDTITLEAAALCQSLLPRPAEETSKVELLRHITQVAKNVFGDAAVLPFGSTGNGLALANADMDVCVFLKPPTVGPAVSSRSAFPPLKPMNRKDGKGAPQEEEPQEDEEEIVKKVEPVEFVERIGEALEADPEFLDVLMLKRARVPIVKLKHVSGIACDIGYQNDLAIWNTRLLKCYGLIDGRVRQMVSIIKFWAKQRKINNPYLGSLSSYAYVLMVIHVLQRRGILPNLQSIVPGGGKIPILDCQGFNRYFFADIQNLSQYWLPSTDSKKETLGELLYEFFRYYASEFHYASHVVSIRSGGLLTKESKNWIKDLVHTDPKSNSNVKDRFVFCVEDPFELDHNVGRPVDRYTLFTIRGDFMRAAKILSRNGDGAVARLCVEKEVPVHAPSATSGDRRRSSAISLTDHTNTDSLLPAPLAFAPGEDRMNSSSNSTLGSSPSTGSPLSTQSTPSNGRPFSSSHHHPGRSSMQRRSQQRQFYRATMEAESRKAPPT